MVSEKKQNYNQIESLENQISALKLELEDTRFQLDGETERRQFFQLIADFAFAWELWFEADGKIRYSSPSCYDLTGYTSNEIIQSSGINTLLVFETDREKYDHFLSGALAQSLFNQSLEFRILTRTKQLRWCIMNVRGVYDEKGKYLGVRASVHDISRLKHAMGHISNLEKGKEFEQRNKQRLQNQLELKDRELVSFLLQLSQKNELISKIRNLVEENTGSSSPKQRAALDQLATVLEGQKQEPVEWNMVERQVEKLHPGFLDRLKKRHSNITLKDIRLCSYIRLGLSSKDIANLVGNTPKSIEIARVRLRKKMRITENSRLSSYLLNV